MRLVALSLLLAACLSKPDRPAGPELCGNGVVDVGERCDDGNDRSNDGCSDRCEIEAWFECPTAGTACHPILELQWTDPGNTLSGIGGGGGGDFDDDCSAIIGLSVRNTVIVGIEGGDDGFGSLTRTRLICADIVELRRDGGIHWDNAMSTPSHGDSPTSSPAMEMCDDDEVVTGFVGNSDNVVSGVQLACQALTHLDGTLGLRAANRLPTVGDSSLMAQLPQSCGPLEIARGFVGKSGAVIDRFSLRCVPTVSVVCGDGRVDDPETCDDGNAIDGDGCNATCDGD